MISSIAIAKAIPAMKFDIEDLFALFEILLDSSGSVKEERIFSSYSSTATSPRIVIE